MNNPGPITVDSLGRMMLELQDQVAKLTGELRVTQAINFVLMAQHGDPTHLSVTRAAELRGCSRRTMQREVDRGVYTLEVDPLTGKKGIPIAQFYANWMPVGAAKAALAREREGGAPQGGTLKRKRHG